MAKSTSVSISTEYYIRRTGEITFAVAKFNSMTGGEQPLAVYSVIWDPSRNRGKCDCPAGMYRGTGADDKHVKMVRDWITQGELAMTISKKRKP